jgi:lysosomal Pro-X carboxypeptidase
LDDKTKYADIKTAYNVCDAITTADEVQQLIDRVNNAFGNMAMVNYPYPADLITPMPAWPVKASCEEFKGMKVGAADKDVWAGTAKASDIFYGNKDKCIKLTKPSTEEVTYITDYQGWDYMACNEMIMPENTNGVTDMFLPNLYDPEADAAYCMESYGLTSQPDFCLDYFGGRQPNLDFKDHTNIIFSNGSLDPWHIGGVLKNVSDPTVTKTIAIWIEDSAHHFDLRATNAADPQSVTDARYLESLYINDYIDQYNKIVASEKKTKTVEEAVREVIEE